MDHGFDQGRNLQARAKGTLKSRTFIQLPNNKCRELWIGENDFFTGPDGWVERLRLVAGSRGCRSFAAKEGLVNIATWADFGCFDLQDMLGTVDIRTWGCSQTFLRDGALFECPKGIVRDGRDKSNKST
jgi:hypothetical protein